MSTHKPFTLEDDARFKSVIARVLINEGSHIVDNKATGEVSKYGISLAFLRGLRNSATKEEIAALTVDGAKHLYRLYFWNAVGIWRIDDDKIAYKLCDLGVNMGPATAVKLLQRAAMVKSDGVLGPITATAVNEGDAQLILARFMDFAESCYRIIATADPNKGDFLAGWLKRLEQV